MGTREEDIKLSNLSEGGNASIKVRNIRGDLITDVLFHYLGEEGSGERFYLLNVLQH